MNARLRTANEPEETDRPVILTLKQIIKMPTVCIAWAVMFAANAIECLCGAWGATYLVEQRRFTPENSALALTLYYAGLALGRLLSGLLSKKIRTWQRVHIGITGVVLSVGLMSLPSPVTAIAGLFMAGFGNGSIYLNLVYLTPYNCGKDVSQSIMGTLVAVAYIGFMLTPLLFGFVSSWLGIGVFPVFLLVLLAVMAVCIFVFEKQLKAASRYDRSM